MNAEEREDVMARLGRLSPADFERVVWRMLGGLDYQAEARPQARIGEAFQILDAHVRTYEAARLDAMDAKMFGHHTCPA